jgi:NAD(P)-dependent dehydrogenase (short-subunit alcohol dehydrogenase family)
MSTVLVTGAADGLGRALATRLAGEGATVLAHPRPPILGAVSTAPGAPRDAVCR